VRCSSLSTVFVTLVDTLSAGVVLIALMAYYTSAQVWANWCTCPVCVDSESRSPPDRCCVEWRTLSYAQYVKYLHSWS